MKYKTHNPKLTYSYSLLQKEGAFFDQNFKLNMNTCSPSGSILKIIDKYPFLKDNSFEVDTLVRRNYQVHFSEMREGKASVPWL